MAEEDPAVRQLLTIGRERGHVTLDQINDVLPIERMTEAEIGEVVERLERAGVAVEMDASLLARTSARTVDHASAGSPPPTSAERDREAARSAERPRPLQWATGDTDKPIGRRAEATGHAPVRRTGMMLVAAVLAALLLLLIGLAIMA